MRTALRVLAERRARGRLGQELPLPAPLRAGGGDGHARRTSPRRSSAGPTRSGLARRSRSSSTPASTTSTSTRSAPTRRASSASTSASSSPAQPWADRGRGGRGHRGVCGCRARDRACVRARGRRGRAHRAGARAARRGARGGRAARRPRARRAGRRLGRRAGRGRGGRGGAAARPDRRLGQQRDGDRVRAGHRDDARGVPARDRGHLPRLRLGHDGRAPPHAAPRPRGDRAGRLGARLPRRSRCRRPTAARSTRSAGFLESLRTELIHDRQ